jgi:hypothetical protein
MHQSLTNANDFHALHVGIQNSIFQSSDYYGIPQVETCFIHKKQSVQRVNPITHKTKKPKAILNSCGCIIRLKLMDKGHNFSFLVA